MTHSAEVTPTRATTRTGVLQRWGAALIGLLALCCCAKAQEAAPSLDEVRHYPLVDRAVDPVAGAPRFLDVAIPTEYLDTRILPPPAEGEARALFISVPSQIATGERYFCRVTYSSPNPSGPVGEMFAIDESIAPRFGFPEGFHCRHGFEFEDRRMVDYVCEDPRAREVGELLETNCHFENPLPSATCIVSVRIPSRAYLDCEYSPRNVSQIRAMAVEVSARVESFVRGPNDDQPEVGR